MEITIRHSRTRYIATKLREHFVPNPFRLAELGGVLENTGWRQTGVVEVHDAYTRWYASLVGRIERSRGRISEMTGEQGYDHVHGPYLGLLNAARGGKLGAAIITAARLPFDTSTSAVE